MASAVGAGTRAPWRRRGGGHGRRNPVAIVSGCGGPHYSGPQYDPAQHRKLRSGHVTHEVRTRVAAVRLAQACTVVAEGEVLTSQQRKDRWGSQALTISTGDDPQAKLLLVDRQTHIASPRASSPTLGVDDGVPGIGLLHYQANWNDGRPRRAGSCPEVHQDAAHGGPQAAGNTSPPDRSLGRRLLTPLALHRLRSKEKCRREGWIRRRWAAS